MALPDELLDELLSAHLDGALSGDERTRVEQMLSDDPTIREKFDALVRQREAFRRAIFATPRLPEGFADQVVQATIAQAQADELRPDHPLQLAASGAFKTRKSDDAGPTLRRFLTVAGLAASVLFAAVMVHQFGGDSDHAQTANNLAAAPRSIPESGPDSLTQPAPGDDSVIAVAENSDPAVPLVDPTDVDPVDPAPLMTPESTEPLLADSSVKPGSELTPPDLTPDRSPAMATPELASTEPASPELASTEVAGIAQPLDALMVIEIKQSETGRQIGAFDQVLASVQIEASDERAVDDQLAKAATTNTGADTVDQPAGRILLLESPVKKLDQVVSRIFSDRKGFESVRFSLISVDADASLLRSIDSVRTDDPTKVRQEGQVVPIVGHSGEVFNAWVSQVQNRLFIPVDGAQEARALKPASLSENGPNPIANILFVVR